MSSKPNLVFFGNERLSTGFDASNAPVLRSLINAGYPVAAVVSNYETGRSRKARSLEIKAIADAHGIPVLLPSSPKDIIDELKAFKATAGVLVAYGRIVPQSIIDIFPRGIINLHPSLLPKYRGSTPVESAILNGDKTLGISLMSLAKQMDAGPLYAQKTAPIKEGASKHDLSQQALDIGAQMIIEYLPAILDGSLQPTPQDDQHATYCSLISKQDGIIDWNKPALQLEREVRAYLGWPGSRTQLFGQDVIILEASVVDTPLAPGEVNSTNQTLTVGTAKKSLHIQKLRPAGRSSMQATDFLRGLRF